MVGASPTANPGETTPLHKAPVALLAGPIVPAMLRLGADLPSLFQIVALAAVVFCTVTVSETFAGGRAHRSTIRPGIQPDPAE